MLCEDATRGAEYPITHAEKNITRTEKIQNRLRILKKGIDIL